MTICIFAKEPVPGRVKTRLAAAIGDRAAARLAQAFLDDTIAPVRSPGLTFARSPWAIALGADSPGLPATHVRAAIEALQTHEAVIGPARDGGYYLLGLTRVRRDLLAGVAWSTPRARADTALRLIERGYRTATLRSWFDVDELHDLDRVRALLRRGVVRAEATARVLGA
ncbi:MAG: DUF2064 domain-containing protein [Deltaproteobacteria bacterium]|nr:DUF2064 domain-containing protein [Deltaproteobacteria bacterium]